MHAHDIMQSPYAASVTAAYETACHQIGDLNELYATHPRLIRRLHPYWSHPFSAAVSDAVMIFRVFVDIPGCRLCWVRLLRAVPIASLQRVRCDTWIRHVRCLLKQRDGRCSRLMHW